MYVRHLQRDFARLMREVDQTQARDEAIALSHQASRLAEQIGAVAGVYPLQPAEQQR